MNATERQARREARKAELTKLAKDTSIPWRQLERDAMRRRQQLCRNHEWETLGHYGAANGGHATRRRCSKCGKVSAVNERGYAVKL
jgi:hypothetical protein